MNKMFKKVISSVLAAVMTVGVVGVANVSSVFAAYTVDTTSLVDGATYWNFMGITSTEKNQTLTAANDNNANVTYYLNGAGYRLNGTYESSNTKLKITGESSSDSDSKAPKLANISSKTTNISDGNNIAVPAVNGDKLYVYCYTNGDSTASVNTLNISLSNEGKTSYAANTDTINKRGSVTEVPFEINNDTSGTVYLYTLTTAVDIVAIVKVPGAEVSATGVEFNSSSYETAVGGTVQLGVTVSPSNATNKKVTYTSSDDEIVTVSSTGVASGIAKGTATITAETEDGSFEATTTVNVVDTIKATGVAVTLADSSIYVGKTTTATATVSPDNATDKTVTWSSSNTDVATVGTDGKITGVAAGTATITAKSNSNDEISGSVKITVNAIPVVAPSKTGGSAADLKVAKKTTTYEILTEAVTIGAIASSTASDAPYVNGNLYFNDEVYSAGSQGNNYRSDKKSYDVDEETTANSKGVMVKTNQAVFAVKLANGSKVTVNMTAGGGGARYGLIVSPETDVVVSDNNSLYTIAENALAKTAKLEATSAHGQIEYTNNTGEDEVVYITGTNEIYISQIKVTVPEAEETTSPFDNAQVVKSGDNLYIYAEISATDVANEDITAVGIANGDNVTKMSTGEVAKSVIDGETEIVKAVDGKYFAAVKVTGAGTGTDTLNIIPFTVIGGSNVYGKTITYTQDTN